MSDVLLELLEDFKDEVMDELKKEMASMMEDIGENGGSFIQYGGKLKKYTERLATGAMSKEDFEVRVRDLTRLTEMRLLKAEVRELARAQALVNKTTDLILNKLIGAIL